MRTLTLSLTCLTLFISCGEELGTEIVNGSCSGLFHLDQDEMDSMNANANANPAATYGAAPVCQDYNDAPEKSAGEIQSACEGTSATVQGTWSAEKCMTTGATAVCSKIPMGETGTTAIYSQASWFNDTLREHCTVVGGDFSEDSIEEKVDAAVTVQVSGSDYMCLEFQDLSAYQVDGLKSYYAPESSDTQSGTWVENGSCSTNGLRASCVGGTDPAGFSVSRYYYIKNSVNDTVKASCEAISGTWTSFI